MKERQASRPADGAFQLRPKAFVFLDRSTGTKRFEVKAASDGSLPLDEAISILAMQCVVRGRTPADFHIMVSIADDLLDGLATRANKLIEACLATVLPMQLSQRQQEVFRAVTQNLSNKQIASQLSVAERTVKFHVSALLQKFHVQSRAGLIRKAGDLIPDEGTPNRGLSTESPVRDARLLSAGKARPTLLRIASGERRADR